MTWGLWAVALAGVVAGYAYVGYPALLWIVGAVSRPHGRMPSAPDATRDWPLVTITLPVYNEERVIASTLEAILALEYPTDRLHILVVSDASTDRTDEIVQGFADRGVQLIRLDHRSGKSAAENVARHHLRGEFVVNTDASVRLAPPALTHLIGAFDDPRVGIASGRDASIVSEEAGTNVGESEYVGYEMWIRDLETRLGGIVGASGCFYASRIPLHMEIVPEAQSRDFAAPLLARAQGFRAVSVADAVCYVPRTRSLRQEYRRKVRTMTRGLETLYFKREFLNPFAYGWFAWKLLSHKLMRWLVPWAAVVATIGLIGLAADHVWARWALGGGVGFLTAGALSWWWPDRVRIPTVISLPGYVFWGIVAGLHAWVRALRGDLDPTWEPTRRQDVGDAPVPKT